MRGTTARQRHVMFTLLLGLLLASPQAFGVNEALNGTWLLDQRASDTLAAASKVFNDKLNEQRRRNRRQTFDRTPSERPRGRFDGQVRATTEMISEDMRSHSWGDAPLQRAILNASTLKLYVARKVAVLYDGELRRLLVINPAGRAYSMSGTEITSDAVGRSLTYLEDGQLVIETKVHGGGRMVERYRADDGGERLVMTAELREDSNIPALTFERVFTRAD